MEENIFALINTLSRIYRVLRQSYKITSLHTILLLEYFLDRSCINIHDNCPECSLTTSTITGSLVVELERNDQLSIDPNETIRRLKSLLAWRILARKCILEELRDA